MAEHIKYGDTLRQGTDKLNAAIDHASEAKELSEQAVEIANTATENADAAAVVATEAAQEAITAANFANSEASNLNGLKSAVVTAAENANTSASNAEDKAALAQSKVDELSGLNTEITEALAEVDTATANANTATSNANQAAQEAQSKSEFAEQQGNYAKAQGDAVQEIFDQGLVASVNNQTGAVVLTAEDVGAETPSGAQEKANQAVATAKQYTDNQVSNIDLSGLATKQEVQTLDTALSEHQADDTAHVRYGAASGTNAKTITLNPAPTSLVEGFAVSFKNVTENTNAVTININGLGAKPVVKSNGTPLTSGNLKANSIYTVRYNGSSFILQGEGSDLSDTDMADFRAAVNGILNS